MVLKVPTAALKMNMHVTLLLNVAFTVGFMSIRPAGGQLLAFQCSSSDLSQRQVEDSGHDGHVLQRPVVLWTDSEVSITGLSLHKCI